jgi:hypothetical protein
MLRPEALKSLIASEGYSILYTHLGFYESPDIIPSQTQAALRSLAGEYQAGRIYVTTTSKLLQYCLAHRYLKWDHDFIKGDRVIITIHHLADPISGLRRPTVDELQGITFYVPHSHKTSVFLGETPLDHLVHNPRDHTGQESIMIERTFLRYPL